MIYFTTLIFTLLLSHIAHATPACGDVAPPEEPYDLTYAGAQSPQHPLPTGLLFEVTWSREYSNPNGRMDQVACGSRFPHDRRHFSDIPHFPYIGGAFEILNGSTGCFSCWNLTNLKDHKTVFITAIDHARPDYYNVSKEAYKALGGVGETLLAKVRQVDNTHCGWKK